jgi:hypothetical protein
MKEEGCKSRVEEEIPTGEEALALNRWGKNQQTPPTGHVVKNYPDILKRVYDTGVDLLGAMCF